MVVVGGPRMSQAASYAALGGLAVLGCMILSGFIANRRGGFGPAAVLLPALVIAPPLLLALIVRLVFGGKSAIFKPPTTIWAVHPTGVSVREGRQTEFIARDKIASIELADSLIGEVSVLRLVRRRSSLKGMIGTTPHLYIRGPREQRRTLWRDAKATLGLS